MAQRLRLGALLLLLAWPRVANADLGSPGPRKPLKPGVAQVRDRIRAKVSVLAAQAKNASPPAAQTAAARPPLDEPPRSPSAQPQPAHRTRGEIGESCRAALDCRTHLRCVDRVCVAPAVPGASAPPQSRLRVGLELSAGAGLVRLDRSPLDGQGSASTTEELRFVGGGMGVLELGLMGDQLLVGVGGGIAWPAGLDGRDPSMLVDLRAAWRLWQGSESVGLYLEPRVEGWFFGLPDSPGFGGALAARLRVHWLDIGARVGALTGGNAARRVSATSVVEESVLAFHGTLFLGFSPIVATW